MALDPVGRKTRRAGCDATPLRLDAPVLSRGERRASMRDFPKPNVGDSDPQGSDKSTVRLKTGAKTSSIVKDDEGGRDY